MNQRDLISFFHRALAKTIKSFLTYYPSSGLANGEDDSFKQNKFTKLQVVIRQLKLSACAKYCSGFPLWCRTYIHLGIVKKVDSDTGVCFV